MLWGGGEDIAAFPTAIRHRRSDQVSPMSKAALTRTLEVTSGKSAYKLVIQDGFRRRTKSRGRLEPRQSLNRPLAALRVYLGGSSSLPLFGDERATQQQRGIDEAE